MHKPLFVLGIDIGSYSLKIILTKQNRQGVSILKMTHYVLPSDWRSENVRLEKYRAEIVNFIKTCHHKIHTIALAIPTDSAYFKTIQVDSTLNEEALSAEIWLVLRDLLPYSPEKTYFDFVKMAKPHQEMVHIAACPQETVDTLTRLVDLPKSCHLAVDISALAIGKVLVKMPPYSENETCVVLDVGYLTTRFYAFHSDELLFSRELPIGGHTLTENIAMTESVKLPEAEQLKHENCVDEVVCQRHLKGFCEQLSMTLSVLCSAHSVSPSQLYFTGGGSLFSPLREAVIVQFGDFSVYSLSVQGIDKNTAQFVLAAGLSMRKVVL